MGKKITIDINFDSLPLWQGVKSRPGIEHLFPLNIGWDMRGFICQITHSWKYMRRLSLNIRIHQLLHLGLETSAIYK